MTDARSAVECDSPSGAQSKSGGLPAWVVCAWLLIVLAGCWVPRARMPLSESAVQKKIPHLDKCVHFAFFAIYGVMGRRSRAIGVRVETVLLLGVLVAVVSELGQATHFVNRDADFLDVLADVAGLVAGIAIAGRGVRKARSHGVGVGPAPRNRSGNHLAGPAARLDARPGSVSRS